MKKTVRILWFVLAVLFLSVPPAYSRQKVAVVLSGGGAKGMAHIGALKVIEEAGIPIDYVVGTSMGSIIGGLYAMGYTPQQLDSLVRKQDWATLLSDVTPRSQQTVSERKDAAQFVYTLNLGAKKSEQGVQGVISGRNLDQMFKKLTIGYHHSVDFDSLPTPFACVATDAVNGSEFVFHRGIISTAMRASMAIPGAFSAVHLDSMVLVDGGLVNNYPADVARAMGADIVIGVVFQNKKMQASDLTSLIKVLNNIVNVETRKKLDDNERNSDLVLNVDVGKYSVISFEPSAIDSLILYGERTARQNWDSLKKIAQKVGSTAPVVRPPVNLKEDKEEFFVRKLVFDGVDAEEQKTICQHCHLKENVLMTIGQIENAERQISDELLYNNVTYNLDEMGTSYRLTFIVSGLRKYTLRFGARLDNEEIASLFARGQMNFSTATPQVVNFTARIGKRSYGDLEYGLKTSTHSLLSAAYRFEYNDLNIYDGGDRQYNMVYNLHRAGVHFLDNAARNLRYSLSVDYSYFHYRDILSGENNVKPIESDHFFNYSAHLDYDSRDKAYFPAQGMQFFMDYSLHTDDFIQYKGGGPFHTVFYGFERVFKLTEDRLRLIPSVSGRHILGSDNGAGSYGNYIGGTTTGHYFGWQLPFAGSGHVEMTRDNALAASVDLRQRIGTRNYVWASSALGFLSDELGRIFRSKVLYGFSANYGLDTVVGPLRASAGYSNLTRHLYFYFDLGMNF